MKYIVTWSYKNQDQVNQEIISAKDLASAEKIANEKFLSSKRTWIDIIMVDKTKGIQAY